ncbi:MAG: aromatic amino acid ammonia-lyase [Saprospiraceae bacterium]
MLQVNLNGNELTRDEVIDVAFNQASVEIDTTKLLNSLNYINEVAGKKIVYSITTGFGSNADKPIPLNKAKDLQVNLLRSHACGVGKPFSKEIVRAIMVIRLNTLLKGNSGVQESTVEQLKFFLNNHIHPVIPEQGSVGASGDLCPLSHMALPLIGEGDVEFHDKVYSNLQPNEITDSNSSYSKFTIAFREYADMLNSNIPNDKNKIKYFKPTSLSYKEGLALNNGTAVMTAVGTIALHKAEQLLKVGTLSSALIFEGLAARFNSFGFEPIHAARNQKGQSKIAEWLRIFLKDSKLIDKNQADILSHLLTKNKIPNEILPDIQDVLSIKATDEQIQIPKFAIDKFKYEGGKFKSQAAKIKKQNSDEETEESKRLSNEGDNLMSIATILDFAKKKWKPQDSYSIRCLPQVFGASKNAIDHVIEIVNAELNAAVDNPLFFLNDDKTGTVVSGGNFHGQPIALVMDYLKLALAEMGNITERQINKMVDSATNDGLESFLVYGNGVESGLMIPQYVAAGIVSENKVLVHPASADSIPTCENTEDHVSMGTIAARQALEIADNVEKIIAIAIMTGFYAVTMRLQQFKDVEIESSPEKNLAPATLRFYNEVKEANKEFMKADFLKTDRYLSPEIIAIQKHFDKFQSVANEYLI